MINKTKYINTWNNIQPRYAHLVHNKMAALHREYTKALSVYHLKGLSVIDFGCGGGLFAEYLKDNHEIKGYTGIDIAERSVKTARERVKDKRFTFNVVDPYNLTFPKGDILTCLSVIQHFPDIDYLNYFIDCLDKTEYKMLILQIRNSGENKTAFQNNNYQDLNDIIFSCVLSKEYINDRLKNYRLFNTDKTGSGLSYAYQYFIRNN